LRRLLPKTLSQQQTLGGYPLGHPNENALNFAIPCTNRAIQYLRPSTLNSQLPTLFRLFPPYAIDSVAMFWVIQRIAAL
jgi:hypothetical protein